MEKVDKDALHQDVKAYREANIQPVMLVQRAKLESQIEAQDQATIAELRPVFKAKREEKMAKKRAIQRPEPRR